LGTPFLRHTQAPLSQYPLKHAQEHRPANSKTPKPWTHWRLLLLAGVATAVMLGPFVEPT
jgi:hypothetical protein